MSITERLYDFLGRRVQSARVDAGGVSTLDEVAAFDAALKIVANYIAGAMSTCDINFYENGKRANKSVEQFLWNVSPNPNQSHTDFISDLVDHLVTSGDALVVPVKSGGKVNIFVSDGWTINDVNTAGAPSIFTNVSVEGSTAFKGAKKQYKADEVYYFKLRQPKQVELLRGLGESYDAAASKALSAFGKQTGIRYRLKMANTEIGDAKFQRQYQAQVKKALASYIKNDGGVWIQFRGQELEPMDEKLGISGDASADFDAMCKSCLERTAAAFGMPASMLYGNITNFDQVADSFLTFAIDPIAKLLSDEITRKTYAFDEWQQGSHVLVATSHVKHTDILESADNVDKLVASSVLTPNEVRGILGIDPTGEDWGNTPILTKNYKEVDTNGDE